MQKFTYLAQANSGYIDEIYDRYLKSPDEVDDSWRYFFEGIEIGIQEAQSQHASEALSSPNINFEFEAKVLDLISAYRTHGKLIANIDPLSSPSTTHPYLDLSRFQLTPSDLNLPSLSAGRVGLQSGSTLSDILSKLKAVYCQTVAIEISQMGNVAEQEWLQTQLESNTNLRSVSVESQKQIIERLTHTEGFERFLHTRYVAQKRFSVEGGDSMMPCLDAIIEKGASMGVQEFVIGMAHRGRLNVLTNLFGKKFEQMFVEFEGNYKTDLDKGEGDVKYHKGYSKDHQTKNGKTIHLSLAPNPSHLEFVNAVIEGVARAKQTLRGANGMAEVVPIQIHGDAAFSGQGVCFETLNLSQLEGYGTGGSLHIIVNNQVGFTTSPVDSRSTLYCSDLAKMLEAPIFHVSGDDPETLWWVAQLCMEYRQKFRKDIFIDLVCYRKHGHNEGDEPSFTQPLMYKNIKTHPSTREIYAAKLESRGVLQEGAAQALIDSYNDILIAAQKISKEEAPAPYVSAFEGAWKGFRLPTDEDTFKPVATSVDIKILKSLAEEINNIPSGFHLHSKLSRFFDARLKAVQDGVGIDWGNGETLAFASLISEGYLVRLSGQDAERGTFTHRHSVLNDFETGEKYCPLNKVAKKPGTYEVHNSHLSETGVLGFEYGFATANPNALVIWEAQFGDFANGAQVIIDQFVATAESKWKRQNGTVLLLPHGYEGQGPEHSSARIERFLQLCGRNNIQVANLTTPAQLFHALRRQVKRDFRKPLIVMSPKSMLRHPMAISKIEDFSQGRFFEVLPDSEVAQNAKSVTRVLLCSGKVYYDLLAERTAKKRTDIAIIRIEQLYPWPEKMLAEAISHFSNAKEFVWVQEEPKNMGAWGYIFGQWAGAFSEFSKNVGGKIIRYAGRDTASAPAVGSHKLHESQQKALVEQAFA